MLVLKQFDRNPAVTFPAQTAAFFPELLKEHVRVVSEAAPGDAIGKRVTEALGTKVHNVLIEASNASDSSVRKGAYIDENRGLMCDFISRAWSNTMRSR